MHVYVVCVCQVCCIFYYCIIMDLESVNKLYITIHSSKNKGNFIYVCKTHRTCKTVIKYKDTLYNIEKDINYANQLLLYK